MLSCLVKSWSVAAWGVQICFTATFVTANKRVWRRQLGNRQVLVPQIHPTTGHSSDLSTSVSVWHRLSSSISRSLWCFVVFFTGWFIYNSEDGIANRHARPINIKSTDSQAVTRLRLLTEFWYQIESFYWTFTSPVSKAFISLVPPCSIPHIKSAC